MVERIPLYITDNLPALKKLVKDDNIKGLKRLDRLPGVAHRMFIEILRIQNDQEKSYIIARRYINVMDHLFKLAADRHFFEICYGNEYRKVKTLIVDLEADLEARYEDVAHRKIIEQSSRAQSQLAMRKVTVFDKTFITSTDLYHALMSKSNMLIVDIRRSQDFDQSRICTEEGRLINISEDTLVPGLSANTLAERLKEPTRGIWNKRDSFDVLVLMDWNTDLCNYYGSKVERMRICIVEWDLNRNYKQDPVILSGGFKDFLESYPTEVVNNYVFLSQTYSEIDELLTLDDISYPEVGSGGNVNLKTHKIKSYGHFEVYVGKELDEIQEESVGPQPKHGQPERQFTTSPELRSALVGEPSSDEFINTQEVIPGSVDEVVEGQAPEDEPMVDYRDVSSKNYTKEICKPPSVDRGTKPLYERFTGEGYVGIRNLKNNCYMSCMLQCLKALPLIKSMFVTSNAYYCHIRKQSPTITAHFASVLKSLWDGPAEHPKSYYPEKFFGRVYEINPVYNKGQHEDTFEFFIFLFNLLSEDCSFDLPRRKVLTEREKSWYIQLQGRSSCFVDLFYYQLQNTKVCWHCQKPNLVFDSESTVMLPISEKKEREYLDGMIEEYLKENLVTDYSCADCKLSAAIVNRKAIVLDPEILVIVLKRYTADVDGSLRKIETDVVFPTDGLKFGRSCYKLYSIAQHSGSVSVGHYYASVLLNEATDTWVKFNDEQAIKYHCSIVEVPNIHSSCVGFFYVRQKEKRPSMEKTLICKKIKLSSKIT